MRNKRGRSNGLMSPLQNISTLHGTKQISFFNGNKLNVWTALMIMNLILTLSFLFVIKNRYNNDQIITRIGPNCQLRHVPFPAVSICNFNIVSISESGSIVQILDKANITKDKISSFLENLPKLKDYSKPTNGVDDLTNMLSILKEHYFTVESLMEEVHQKCDKLLLYCEFNRKVKNCDDMFKMVKTYEGFCCTFNYAALNDDSDSVDVAKDDDIEYYDNPSADDVETNSQVVVTSESGRGSGLRVIFNVEPDDYPNWPSLPYYGAKVLLSDPDDYPEITVIYQLLSLGESLDLKVEPMVFLSENDIRRVSPEKRACWFHDEILLEHTDKYSYETCKTECKMQTYLRYCGCVPYKYPLEKSTRICEYENLECLNNVTAYILEEDKACNPVCYMECRDKRYSGTSDLTPFIPELYPANVTKDRNASELSALQVYYAKSLCSTYKLMLLMDFNYFIATYGGLFSLSFGASILTICELAFILVLYFVKMISKNILK